MCYRKYQLSQRPWKIWLFIYLHSDSGVLFSPNKCSSEALTQFVWMKYRTFSTFHKNTVAEIVYLYALLQLNTRSQFITFMDCCNIKKANPILGTCLTSESPFWILIPWSSLLEPAKYPGISSKTGEPIQLSHREHIWFIINCSNELLDMTVHDACHRLLLSQQVN